MGCMQESIHGYPTVRLYKDGDLVEEYQFARTFDRMKTFIEEKLFDLATVEPNSIGVYDLNDLSFQKFIDSQGSGATLVFYHVTWCGHCKALRPVWDELAIDFLMEESEDLKFAEVNCMEALDVCTEEGVEGFPQVYMYKDGVMEDIFQGERTVEELTNFVWETVDPSRVKDDDLDTMLLMQNLMGGDQAGQDKEEDAEEEEEEGTEDGEVSEEEMDHIKKMIMDETERIEEQGKQDGNTDIGDDYDYDADEDAMLFAEGGTEEQMSEEWLRRMEEMDEKKEQAKMDKKKEKQKMKEEL